MAIVSDRHGVRSSKDMGKIMKDVADHMEALQKSYDEACSKGDHGIFLEHIGFWNGEIHYLCRHCCCCVSEPDRPMTI